MIDNGVILATGGTMALAASVTGSGIVDVAADAGLKSGALLGVSKVNLLAGGTHGMSFYSTARVTATISGFRLGDTIDLVKQNVIGLSFADHVLSISESAGGVTSLHFAGSYAGLAFVHTSDTHGGTDITLTKSGHSLIHF